ncbi:MAG: DinB family protein [Luteibaculum sp.]
MAGKHPKSRKLFKDLCQMQKEDINKLSTWPKEQLYAAPNENSWSAIQVLNHLYLSQKGTFNFLNKQLENTKDVPKSLAIKNYVADILLSRFLRSDKKVKAPSKLPEPDKDTDFEVLKEKYTALASLGEEILDKIPGKWSGKAVFRHPRAGWLGTKATFRFLKDHWEHHRYQIKNLEKELANGKA